MEDEIGLTSGNLKFRQSYKLEWEPASNNRNRLGSH